MGEVGLMGGIRLVATESRHTLEIGIMGLVGGMGLMGEVGRDGGGKYAAKGAVDKVAFVADGSGFFEVRNFAVGYHHGIFYLVR